MRYENLWAAFEYDPATGKLRRMGRLVQKRAIELSERSDPKVISYARLCFWLHYGYLPTRVNHRDGKRGNTRANNLVDPKNPKRYLPTGAAGVFEVVWPDGGCAGYCAVFHVLNVRYETPVLSRPELALSLSQMQKAYVESRALLAGESE